MIVSTLLHLNFHNDDFQVSRYQFLIQAKYRVAKEPVFGGMLVKGTVPNEPVSGLQSVYSRLGIRPGVVLLR